MRQAYAITTANNNLYCVLQINLALPYNRPYNVVGLSHARKLYHGNYPQCNKMNKNICLKYSGCLIYSPHLLVYIVRVHWKLKL